MVDSGPSAFLLPQRWFLGAELSWGAERGEVARAGDGVGSPGDKGDMTGALKGRGVLQSVVDTVATAGWTEKQSSAIEGG